MLRFASLVLALLLVAPSGSISLAGAQDAAKPKDTKLKKLLAERLDEARRLAEICVAQYKAGAMDFERVQNAQKALFHAELDSCESSAERIVVMEKAIALARITEELVAAGFKAGTVSEADVRAARVARLDVQIALEKIENSLERALLRQLVGNEPRNPKLHYVPFVKSSEGKHPDGWKEDRTGTGEGSVWRVQASGSGKTTLMNVLGADKTLFGESGFVLAQTAAGPKAMFNLCVFQNANLKDLELQVAFKADKGEIDQGGGLVWRYQDAKNYYVVRMNPLEDNFRVYKVQNGKRTQLQSADKISIKQGTWHWIKVLQFGDRIICYLDGKRLLDVQDATFTQSGKIGLWTKADAQTSFDQFRWSDLEKDRSPVQGKQMPNPRP